MDMHHCLSLDFVQLFDEPAAPNVLSISDVQHVRWFHFGTADYSFCKPLFELLGTGGVMRLMIDFLVTASLEVTV